MIGQDFDAFDPREHRWVHIRLAGKLREGHSGVASVGVWLEILASAVNDASSDPFEAAHDLQYEITADDAIKIFEAKPGAFGFSVDLVAGADFLVKLVQRWKA